MADKILCRAPFPYGGIHICSNLICFCSDFRFRRAIEKLERVLGIYGNVDGIQIPGGIKAINDGMDLGWWRMLHKLHGIMNFYLIAHAGCGAYAEAGIRFTNEKEEQEFHEEQLSKARGLIQGMIPGARVRLFYARVNKKNRRQVEFVEID